MRWLHHEKSQPDCMRRDGAAHHGGTSASRVVPDLRPMAPHATALYARREPGPLRAVAVPIPARRGRRTDGRSALAAEPSREASFLLPVARSISFSESAVHTPRL